MGISQSELVHELRHNCAVTTGQVWMVHASMRAIGQVAGGPKAVIKALQQAVGPTGTLLMPTFTSPAVHTVVDLSSTPSRTGLISETFRIMPGVARSLHPTHSVSAWGQLRDELLADHDQTSGLGVDSPLHKAAQQQANVLLLGCDFRVCSVIHVAEAICRVPYLGRSHYRGYDQELTLVDTAGRKHRVLPCDPPGDSSQFTKIGQLMEQRGLVRHGTLGQASCMMFAAADALDVAVQLLRDDPLALLCYDRHCVYCLKARRALAKLRVDSQVTGIR